MGFVINVDQLSTPINNARKRSISSLTAFIVGKKDILQEIAQKMKKVYIEREALVLGVGR